MHPFECPTNYAALVAMRCNVDVQDMRRVLPPSLWMPEKELEPDIPEEQGGTYTHGAYPQRCKDFSPGPQANWGWLQHLATTEQYANNVVIFQDWHDIFVELSRVEPATDDTSDSTEAPASALAAGPPSHQPTPAIVSIVPGLRFSRNVRSDMGD